MFAAAKKKSKSRKKTSTLSPKVVTKYFSELDAQQVMADERFGQIAEYLRHRKGRPSLDALVEAKGEPALCWGLPTELDAELSRTLRLILAIPAGPSVAAAEWLRQSEYRPIDFRYALECLGWCHALPELAQQVDGGLWWQLMDHLITSSSQFLCLGRTELWTGQLMGAEIPITLAFLLPEHARTRKLAETAVEFLSQSLTDGLDGAGMLPGGQLEQIRPLLSCWTRCGFMINEMKGLKVSKPARAQFRWFVRHALRLTRRDGTSVFLPANTTRKSNPPLFRAALRLTGHGNDKSLAKWVFGDGRESNAVWREPDLLHAEASYHSEWSEVAVLQPGWSSTGPRLVVDYGQQPMRLELSSRGQLALGGKWNTAIHINGEPAPLQVGWECVCWHSDQDLDYLELHCDIGEDWTLQRQLLMAREDLFLFVADVVIGPASASIDYRSSLPLAVKTRFDPAEESREGHLRGGKRLGLVLPLAFPEWRLAPVRGDLHSASDNMVLDHNTTASGLYLPLFFDLHPRRMQREPTWRQLTVAEELEIITPDVAAAYRVQVGTEQWLFYRSLTDAASRTFVGQNLIGEFLAARFLNDGQIEELIQVS